MKVALVIFSLLLSFGLTSCNAQSHSSEEKYSSCEGLSKIETLGCKQAKLDSINLLINERVKSLSKKFGNDKGFEEVQNSWQKYSEANCESYISTLGGSTQTQILYLDCSLELAQRRVKDLLLFEGID